MTTYTALPNTAVQPGGRPRGSTITALRDNPIAMFEGDATAITAGVTLRDAALNTGAATVAGTDWVALRTAGVAAGAIGSYAFLFLNAVSASVAAGSLYAGSSLRYAGLYTGPTLYASATALAGTWRAMGTILTPSGSYAYTLFLRVS